MQINNLLDRQRQYRIRTDERMKSNGIDFTELIVAMSEDDKLLVYHCRERRRIAAKIRAEHQKKIEQRKAMDRMVRLIRRGVER